MGRTKANKISITDAVESLVQAKNLSEEFILDTLKSTLKKTFTKIFLGSNDDDAIVRVELEKKGKSESFVIYYGRKVQEEDKITDDFFEISEDDPNVKEAELKVGDLYEVRYTLEDIINDRTRGSKFINSFSTSFRSKVLEAEKATLIELYKGKLGELITGIVTQYNRETHEAVVEIGKNTEVTLERKDQIGDETFKVGESIKVCVASVDANQAGAKIHISRSNPLFLKRLFEQEIHEVYDGTVVIKDIARRAGERSKVAVYSNDPNVDPCGTCIGKNGDRIGAITKNFGNSKDKEKIDVVLYDENLAIYIAEALVPAHVVGLTFIERESEKSNELEKVALAVVKDGELSTAIGKKGCNVSLAAKLTGIKIEIKEHQDALKEGIQFKTMETIRDEAKLSKLEKTVLNSKDEFKENDIEDKDLQDDEKVIENSVESIDSTVDKIDKDLNIKVEDNIPSEEAKTEVKVDEKPQDVKEEKKPEEKTHVNVDTIKMEDLLNQLEKEKEQEESKKAKSNKKSYKKKEDKSESESKDANKKPIKGMAIYTDEELEELKREEEEEDESYGVDEDDDYDEYDSDEYYEDK